MILIFGTRLAYNFTKVKPMLLDDHHDKPIKSQSYPMIIQGLTYHIESV